MQKEILFLRTLLLKRTDIMIETDDWERINSETGELVPFANSSELGCYWDDNNNDDITRRIYKIYDTETKSFSKLKRTTNSDIRDINFITNYSYMPLTFSTRVTLNGDIISLTILSQMAILRGENLVIDDVVRCFSMNIKSGRSYLCFKINGKMTRFRDISYSSFGTIENMFNSYYKGRSNSNKEIRIIFSFPVNFDLEEEVCIMYNKFKELKQSYFKFPIKFYDFSSNKNNGHSYYSIRTYSQLLSKSIITNRLPCASSRTIRFALDSMLKFPKITGLSCCPEKELFINMHVPYIKSIREIYEKNSSILIFLTRLLKIWSLDNSLKIVEIFLETNLNYHDTELQANSLIQFVKEQGTTQKALANKLSGDNFRETRDILRIYKQIKDINPEFNCDIAGTTIHDAHDMLTLEFNKLKKVNREIKYSKDELLLNKTYEVFDDKYEFRLAKDTHYLVDVGRELNICVGGYGEGAVRKDFNIVILYRNDHIKVCIEIENNNVRQAKAYRNGGALDDEKDIILKWVKDTKLHLETSDLELEHNERGEGHDYQIAF